MPGGQIENKLLGFSHERLASFILGELAFVTRVPGPSDVGHDLVCALREADDNNPKYQRAGLGFTVQVKSNRDALPFKEEHQVKWLTNLESPYFIGVVDRRSLSIQLYSTWNVHNSYLWRGPKKITLSLKKQLNDPDKPTHPRTAPEAKEKQTVPLGKPILEIAVTDVNDEEKMDNYHSILKEWILMEQRNIVNVRQKMHWIDGFTDYQYETNSRFPTPDGPVWLYFNMNNERAYIRNLTRMAAIYWLAWVHSIEKKEQAYMDTPAQIRVARISVFKTIFTVFWRETEPVIRRLLQDKGLAGPDGPLP